MTEIPGWLSTEIRNMLLVDYDKADRKVEQEERFEELERRQAEQSYERRHTADGNDLLSELQWWRPRS